MSNILVSKMIVVNEDGAGRVAVNTGSITRVCEEKGSGHNYCRIYVDDGNPDLNTTETFDQVMAMING